MANNNRKVEKITEEIILHSPLAFEEESGANKLKLILSWLLPKNERQQVMTGKLIQNIVKFLNAMKFNGYLRLFDENFELLKQRMTDTSWKLFLNFKEKRKNDEWICPTCAKFYNDKTSGWKCSRCLFYYHNNCAIPNGTNNNLCFSCFFRADM